MSTGFQTIPLENLRESKANPRTRFDEKGISELADSIKEHGVLTPLLVRPLPDGDFEIAAGHRRFRAAKRAGVGEVPAIVREMSDVELLEMLVVDNGQREDVHPIEEGNGYNALIKAGYTVERIAERVGRHVNYVYERLKLLELGKEGQGLFFEGKITFGHARLLSRLKPEDQKRALARPKDEYGSRHAGGVFVVEHTPDLDFNDRKKELPLKSVSVRELAAWINENVRLDPSQADVQDLFPETAAAIAESAEKEEKVVTITREYQLPDSAKSDQRVLTARAWKRADGAPDEIPGSRKKSKTCEVSVLGVIVIGPGRGESFRVCADKLCETHWGAEQREKAKAGKTKGGEADRYASEQKKREVEYRSHEIERKRWSLVAPHILKAVAERVKLMPAKANGLLGQIVLDGVAAARSAGALVPRGKTAEDLVRHAAFLLLQREIQDDWNASRLFPRRAKALGVDLAKILKEHAAAEGEKKPAKKQAAKA